MHIKEQRECGISLLFLREGVFPKCMEYIVLNNKIYSLVF